MINHNFFEKVASRNRENDRGSNFKTFQSPPYSMYQDSPKRMTGNDAFEGYAIDLITEIAQILSKYWLNISKKKIAPSRFVSEFNYTFKWVDDHKYGKRDQETGEWNGMMGELLAQVRYTLICFSLICLHCTPRFNASWFIGRDLFLFPSPNKIEVNRTFSSPGLLLSMHFFLRYCFSY